MGFMNGWNWLSICVEVTATCLVTMDRLLNELAIIMVMNNWSPITNTSMKPVWSFISVKSNYICHTEGHRVLNWLHSRSQLFGPLLTGRVRYWYRYHKALLVWYRYHTTLLVWYRYHTALMVWYRYHTALTVWYWYHTALTVWYRYHTALTHAPWNCVVPFYDRYTTHETCTTHAVKYSTPACTPALRATDCNGSYCRVVY